MHAACGAMDHDQGRVCHPLTIGSESRACKSTPPFAHRPRPTGAPRMRATRRPVRPRLTLTHASPSAAEPAGRHPHRSPRPYLVALREHTRPSSPAALYKTPSILTHRSPNPSSGAAPRVGAASPALPYGGGAQSNANRDVSMPGTSDGRSRACTNIRPSPPRGGGAARPPIRGRAHVNRGKKTQPAPRTLLACRVSKGGFGGRGCGPGSCVCEQCEDRMCGRLSTRPRLVQ